jgi:hypothetical protein
MYMAKFMVFKKHLKVQKSDKLFIKEPDLLSFLNNTMRVSYSYGKVSIMLDTIQNQLMIIYRKKNKLTL